MNKLLFSFEKIVSQGTDDISVYFLDQDSYKFCKEYEINVFPNCMS